MTVLDEKLVDVGYESWTNIYNKHEPSADRATNGEKQDCVDIVKQGGGMDDNYCFEKMSYICKICKTGVSTKECKPGNFTLDEKNLKME